MGVYSRNRVYSLGAYALMLGGAGVSVSHAQSEQSTPVHWRLDHSAASSEFRREMLVEADIAEGWYLYSALQPPGGPIPLSFDVGVGYNLVGEIKATEPRRYADRNFNIYSQIYEGRAEFQLLLQREPSQTDSPDGRVYIRYQACTRRYCLPPRVDTLVAVPSSIPPESTLSDAARPLQDSAHGRAALGGEFKSAERGGPADSGPDGAEGPVWLPVETSPVLVAGPGAPGPDSFARFLWLAVGMGLLSLLSPCVFPMVPITVGFFSRERGHGRAAPVVSTGAYAIGIVLTFTVAGFAIANLVGAAEVIRLAADPWFNTAIGLLFILFALNLLGAYAIRLPPRLLERIGQVDSKGAAPAAAFAMGAAFAVTSFSCTAPFVGTLLVLAAQGGWAWPISGLAVYASAFATPFLLLAFAPRLLGYLPKSGAWMATLRSGIGIIEIAAAVKFFSNADLVWKWGYLTREVVVGVWVLVLLALSFVFVRHATRVEPRAPKRVWHPAGGLALLSAGLALSLTLHAARGGRLGEMEAFLPPAAHRSGEPAWRENDFDGALASARAQSRPLIIDFTGYTCTNCRWMEANMFPRREVVELLRRFERVRLYTDGEGAVYERQQRFQQQRFGTVALPYYAVVDPSGRTVGVFLGMTRDVSDYAGFLREALAASERVVVDQNRNPSPILR